MYLLCLISAERQREDIVNATHPRRDREQIIADIVARTGIDEPMIERLVRSFYDRARRDPLIGPVFEYKVKDWEAHIPRMCAFWSSVAQIGRAHADIQSLMRISYAVF